MTKITITSLANLLFSYFLMRWIYSYLHKKNIVDLPNKRSLHTKPKIRGGGIAILISYEIFCFIFFQLGYIPNILYTSQLFGALILGIIGWTDDIKGISILIRLLSHILSAFLVLFIFNGIGSITLIEKSHYFIILINVLALLFIVWMINLYNFMDGIDGLALSEAIIPALFLIILFWMENREISLMALILVLSSIAFYKYNWPPSRMFMGDVLSGFLGFFYAVIAIYINNFTNYSMCIILILLAGFIYDSTLTLLKRIIKREKIWEAHSSHLYQQFAKLYGHKKVTISFIILNFLLFIPAYLTKVFKEYNLYITILTYILIGLTGFIIRKLFITSNISTA